MHAGYILYQGWGTFFNPNGIIKSNYVLQSANPPVRSEYCRFLLGEAVPLSPVVLYKLSGGLCTY